MKSWLIMFVALAGLAAAFTSPARADTCGEENQPACRVLGGSSYVDPMTRIPYSNWYYTYTCSHGLTQEYDSNNILVCKNVQVPSGLTCCTQVNYYDRYGTGSTLVTQGYYAQVDLTKAWIVVPNLTYPDWCVANPTYKNPVMTGEQWASYGGYNVRLVINANFWAAESNPYLSRCNGAKGLTVSNTVVVSPNGPFKGQNTASLVFFTPDQVRARGRNAVIAEDALTTYGSGIQNAVSGFLLMRNGQLVAQPAGITPNAKLPRAAAGLSADGNTLYLAVVNPGDNRAGTGGTTLNGLASYLHSLGAADVLTLDGSGSAQLYYRNPATGQVIKTEMSDNECYSVPLQPRCYRPVPIFLGVQ